MLGGGSSGTWDNSGWWGSIVKVSRQRGKARSKADLEVSGTESKKVALAKTR